MLFHTKEGRIRATGQEKLAASQSVKGNLDERDFLLRWANVAEYE